MSLKNSILQRPNRKEVLDVTNEYMLSAIPAQGSVTYDEGYEIGKHRDEIKMSDWLFKTFGGKIKLLKESGIKNHKTPDYLWNDKYWELKCARSISGADKLLQRAVKQIQKPYGGVIVNMLEDFDTAELEQQLVRRIARSSIENLDIMILAKGELVKIFRYKK